MINFLEINYKGNLDEIQTPTELKNKPKKTYNISLIVGKRIPLPYILLYVDYLFFWVS